MSGPQRVAAVGQLAPAVKHLGLAAAVDQLPGGPCGVGLERVVQLILPWVHWPQAKLGCPLLFEGGRHRLALQSFDLRQDVRPLGVGSSKEFLEALGPLQPSIDAASVFCRLLNVFVVKRLADHTGRVEATCCRKPGRPGRCR